LEEEEIINLLLSAKQSQSKAKKKTKTKENTTQNKTNKKTKKIARNGKCTINKMIILKRKEKKLS